MSLDSFPWFLFPTADRGSEKHIKHRTPLCFVEPTFCSSVLFLSCPPLPLHLFTDFLQWSGERPSTKRQSISTFSSQTLFEKSLSTSRHKTTFCFPSEIKLFQDMRCEKKRLKMQAQTFLLLFWLFSWQFTKGWGGQNISEFWDT